VSFANGALVERLLGVAVDRLHGKLLQVKMYAA
jgi:hypothetical protein